MTTANARAGASVNTWAAIAPVTAPTPYKTVPNSAEAEPALLECRANAIAAKLGAIIPIELR